jgi:outer membrane protein OmpA-like peptidoglycan-associated protein
MNPASRFIVVFAVALDGCISGTCGRTNADLRERPAVDLILNAFEDYPLVALSEGAGHGQLDTRDFFSTLIRDSRFPHAVRNIVIEFGNARYQAVMDRYVSGEPVARDELRHVWEDTTQVTGIWSLPMYERMLAAVRSVNAGLPDALRVRVLLGDPPINWSTVTSPADEDMNDWRDAHVASVIDREVVRRHQRALILIGGAHISRKVLFPNSLIHLLDSRFPGKTWVVGILDFGRVDPDIRTRLRGWTVPAGVAVRDTWLGKVKPERIGFTLSMGGALEDDVDALLLLTAGPPQPSEPAALDPMYELELARRRSLARTTLAFRGAKIRFEENRAVFAEDAEGPLLSVRQELLRDRGLRLLVKAFADQAESDAAALSRQRAALVVNWLAARGVERQRMIPRGCGAVRPLDFGNSASGRAMNRRAELVRLTPTAGCEPPW